MEIPVSIRLQSMCPKQSNGSPFRSHEHNFQFFTELVICIIFPFLVCSRSAVLADTVRYVSDGVVLPSVYHGGASVFVTAYMGNKNRIANRVSTKLLILITDSLLGTPSRVLVQKYLLCILISKDEQK